MGLRLEDGRGRRSASITSEVTLVVPDPNDQSVPPPGAARADQGEVARRVSAQTEGVTPAAPAKAHSNSMRAGPALGDYIRRKTARYLSWAVMI